MSTQRRRVLEDDEGITTITDNGVYIESINGKFYTTDTWASSKIANSIVVASDNARFRIALTQPSSTMKISDKSGSPLENYMTAIKKLSAAKADYDGAGNTAKILKLIPSVENAAGYCNAFTFPDGKTKGYLPSYGQLWITNENREAVNAAINTCGGTVVASQYWSSTFWGVDNNDGYKRKCLALSLSRDYIGYLDYWYLNFDCYVRPFANLD